MKNTSVFCLAMVIFVFGLAVVRCDDGETACKTLVNDYSVLLKLIKLEEEVMKQGETIKEHREEIRGKLYLNNRQVFVLVEMGRLLVADKLLRLLSLIVQRFGRVFF
jgi:hypothetical protein